MAGKPLRLQAAARGRYRPAGRRDKPRTGIESNRTQRGKIKPDI